MSELTHRQAQVATLVARGLHSKAIASELGIAVRTVEDHVAQAAARIPLAGSPRHKCTLWFFFLSGDDSSAA